MRGKDNIRVEAIEGHIEFPKQWALLEIHQTYLYEADIFNGPVFAAAMERAGLSIPVPQNALEAQAILQEHYAALPDPSK